MPKFRIGTAALTLAAALCLSVAAPHQTRADEVDLWPVYEKDGDSTTVLYPFYVSEGDFLMLFPLYYRTNEGNDQHVLWPLLKWSDGRLERAAPFYYSPDEEQFALFPLIYQSPTATVTTVPPMVLSDDYTAFLPLYLRVGEHRHYAAPNLYWETDASGVVREAGALGLARYSRDDTSTNLDALILFSLRRGDNSRWTKLLPLFSFGHEENLRWRSVGPLYDEQDGAGRHDVRLFPVFERIIGPGEDYLQLGTFVREESDDVDHLELFPLFADHERREEGVRIRTLDLLWPLYARETRFAPDGERLERHRRFGIFSDSFKKGVGRTFRVLGIPIVERLDTPPPAVETRPEASRGDV